MSVTVIFVYEIAARYNLGKTYVCMVGEEKSGSYHNHK